MPWWPYCGLLDYQQGADGGLCGCNPLEPPRTQVTSGTHRKRIYLAGDHQPADLTDQIMLVCTSTQFQSWIDNFSWTRSYLHYL